jgi:hypothetical protein
LEKNDIILIRHGYSTSNHKLNKTIKEHNVKFDHKNIFEIKEILDTILDPELLDSPLNEIGLY